MSRIDFKLPPFTVKKVVSTLSQSQGWGIKQLNFPNTWTITKGEGQIVMVIDTGFSEHPDLRDGMIKSLSKSFVPYETVIDNNGHETHCLGIIGARNNNIGMVGGAPECNMVACKALDESGSGRNEWINKALEYALEIKPNVISMSLGSPQNDKTMHELIKKLYALNIPIIAATGNDGRHNSVNYPGKYPETICVGAYDKYGKIADFTSTGPELDFNAPGVDIYSTWLNNEYAVLSGSSMATPLMASIVLLLLAKHAKQEKETGKNDCKTVAQIKEHLIKYSTKGVLAKDDYWGYGIVDPVKLIAETSEIILPDNPPKQPSEPKLSWWTRFVNWFFGKK